MEDSEARPSAKLRFVKKGDNVNGVVSGAQAYGRWGISHN